MRSIDSPELDRVWRASSIRFFGGLTNEEIAEALGTDRSDGGT